MVGADDSRDAGKMAVTISVVEPLGDEMIVHLSTSKNNLISKVDSHQKLEVDDEIEAALDLSKAHIFDLTSGRNLTLDGGAAET